MLTSPHDLPASTDLPTALSTPVAGAGPIKVLVVDDDRDLCAAVKGALENRFACEFVESHSFACALAEITRRRSEQGLASNGDKSGFDVIFLENDLPDEAGIELLKQLRLQGDTTPVVIMADAGREEIAVEAMRGGACDYIVKSGDFVPFFPDIVSHVVERDRMRRYYNRLEAEHVRFARLAAVGEMSAGIIHEIRNPMQVVAGMASLMRDDLESLSPEEIRHCARAIAENCAHLQCVLEDVLSEAQPDAGHEVLRFSELIEETISFMRFDSDFRRYAVVDCDFQTPGEVVGSRDHLKQVLINLLCNAAQAIAISGLENGPVCISLHEDMERCEVVLQIQDSGDGIAADILPRIFESGFSTKQRARNRHQIIEGQSPALMNDSPGESTPAAAFDAPKIHGSGLGLHICRRLIEAHGGRIWVQNAAILPASGAAMNQQKIPTQDLNGALFCIALPSACRTSPGTD